MLLIISDAFRLFPVIEAFEARRVLKSTPTSFGSIRSPLLLERTYLFAKQKDDNYEMEEKVKVGTKEYYNGFLSSPMQGETAAQRGDGLEQALKLGGGVVLVLVVFVFGFLASNNLI